MLLLIGNVFFLLLFMEIMVNYKGFKVEISIGLFYIINDWFELK